MSDETNGGRARPRHSIRVVAERTGLSPDVLRVWERRYAAVVPARDETGQRVYTDADVERLRLLHAATRAGRAIGRIAEMPLEELESLVREDEAARAVAPGRELAPEPAVDLDQALLHCRMHDPTGLEGLLERWLMLLGAPTFLERAAAPLLRRIGDEWHAGRLTPAQEHLATAAVERVVAGTLSPLAVPPDAPTVIVTTPAGERHQSGALLAAAAAATTGWHVIFLGADLPAESIAEAAVATGAEAVGLSLVFAENRMRAVSELRELRRLLAPHVRMLVGGGAASALRSDLEPAGMQVFTTLDELREALLGAQS